MSRKIILLAGAGGDLGGRIARELRARGAKIRALSRNNISDAEKKKLSEIADEVFCVDPLDPEAQATACLGAQCVVSALNGLRHVIVDRQSVLLDAAVRAGVPRFIPSDYAADFTKTTPGRNRNLDLRREFMEHADKVAEQTKIQLTSVLNGAFMDMLGEEMPLIQPAIKRVLYWQSADQKLDFTTKDNVASYVAAVAMDQETPRIMRIAGDTMTAKELAGACTVATGADYHTLCAGNIATLSLTIEAAKLIAPQKKEVFPPWQGMQYLRDMFSGEGKLEPLDNGRYPAIQWTSVLEHLTGKLPDATKV